MIDGVWEGADDEVVTACPKLPTELRIDGHEVSRPLQRSIHPADPSSNQQLWDLMMTPALTPDPIILTAINALRGPSLPFPSLFLPH